LNPLTDKLLNSFNAGVQAVVGDVAVHNALIEQPLASSKPVYLLAIGKAADAMVRGAVAGLVTAPVGGLMVTKHDHSSTSVRNLPWLTVMESSHPVPDQSSLNAGAAVVAFVKSVPSHSQLLVLMSGGASALIEHLVDGLTLSHLQQVTDQLLAGGLAIGDMNRVRKTLSAVKGGKLAHYLPEVPVTQLMISDVPGDKISDIGSGVLALPENTIPMRFLARCVPMALMPRRMMLRYGNAFIRVLWAHLNMRKKRWLQAPLRWFSKRTALCMEMLMK